MDRQENNLKECESLVKKKIRIVSMLLTVVLIMSAFVTPVAAGQGSGRGQERELRGQGSRLILSEPLSKEMKNLIKLRGADIKITQLSHLKIKPKP